MIITGPDFPLATVSTVPRAYNIFRAYKGGKQIEKKKLIRKKRVRGRNLMYLKLKISFYSCFCTSRSKTAQGLRTPKSGPG